MTEPAGTGSTGSPVPAPSTPEQIAPEPSAPAAQPSTPPWNERVESFGQEVEAAAQRLAKDPRVQEPVDIVARAWGLLLLLAGLWFFGAVTLRLDLPAVAWGDVWPAGLILLGGFIVLRGALRRA
jgi:hypothetical protein